MNELAPHTPVVDAMNNAQVTAQFDQMTANINLNNFNVTIPTFAPDFKKEAFGEKFVVAAEMGEVAVNDSVDLGVDSSFTYDKAADVAAKAEQIYGPAIAAEKANQADMMSRITDTESDDDKKSHNHFDLAA